MSRLFKASIVKNIELAQNHFLLTLHPLEKIRKPKPGTFFMLSVDNGLDPLLKRPISIHRWLSGDFQLLYRVVGKGTDILSERRPGDLLEVLGPLGNGFPSINKINKTILVAGGLGIAPIFGLAENLLTSAGASKPNTLLFYGARTKSEVLCLNELKSIDIEPVVSTDDGTYGKKGNIVNVLKKFISHNSSPITHYSIYACGPQPMLKSLAALAHKIKFNGFAALEQNMACGLGTCLGCVVNTIKGYKRVCKEGPVFPIEEIVW